MELNEILKIAEENNNKKKELFISRSRSPICRNGKEIYNEYEEAKKYMTKQKNIRNANKKICFEGPEEDLNKTENTQMAIFVTSLAMLESFKKQRNTGKNSSRIKPRRIYSISIFRNFRILKME